VRASSNQLYFGVEDVHAGEIEKRTDGGISTVCMIVPGISEFEPVAKPFFYTNVQIVTRDRARINHVNAQSRRAQPMMTSRYDLGPRLKKDAGLTVHVKSLAKRCAGEARRQKYKY
jgi:hypothetical protein